MSDSASTASSDLQPPLARPLSTTSSSVASVPHERAERGKPEASSHPIKEDDLGPSTLPIYFSFSSTTTPLALSSPHTFMHGLLQDGSLHGPFVAHPSESSLPHIISPSDPSWHGAPALPKRKGDKYIQGLRKLYLDEALSHGQVWDAFKGRLQVYQSKNLIFEEPVIVKTTDPSRFPPKPHMPGMFTETEARRAIFHESKIYTDFQGNLQGSVVPGSYGLWGGRLKFDADDDDEEEEEGGGGGDCEVWVMILENCGMPVDVARLSESDKKQILSHYTALHDSGILHGDPDPRHWRYHPDGGIRIIDFDSATVLPTHTGKVRMKGDGRKARMMVEDEMDLVKHVLIGDDEHWYV
ncbi:hypothetical protein I350_03907 [Cryptococcus amylolentus CBS 6273]|uniref:Protein kinase domain-containing protein n=1 Tax=Cryptococcus amylolentus CBS 6273 TaxID=1296118 RepID=A0A1E3K2W4_9TREE|nr:hypothetical protein I350_03907 [Cryptococcus amylolentus CBS 6273]